MVRVEMYDAQSYIALLPNAQGPCDLIKRELWDPSTQD